MCLEFCGPFFTPDSICASVEDQNEALFEIKDDSNTTDVPAEDQNEVLFEITAEPNPTDDSENEYRFVCERGCGFKTNHKNDFTKHLNKKKPCKPPIHGVEKNSENQYVCPRNCGYKTNHRGSFTNHLNKKKPCKPQVPDDMKICRKCNVTKSKTEFTTNSKTKDGLHSWCKACLHESNKCDHGKQRDQCPECIDFSKGISKKLCKICLETQVCGKRIEIGICAGCDTNKAPTIENEMRDLIEKYVGHEPSSVDTTIANDNQLCENMTKHRPDFTFADRTVVIVVEIDEDGGHVHPSYESKCESKKVTCQNEAIQKIPMYENIPVITLRVNPDQ